MGNQTHHKARRFRWRVAGSVASLIAASLNQGCGSRERTTPANEAAESQGTARQALSVDATRAFGFESAADWSSSNGPVALAPRHSQGTSSLQVASTGTVTVTSIPVSGPIAATSTLALDVIV